MFSQGVSTVVGRNDGSGHVVYVAISLSNFPHE